MAIYFITFAIHISVFFYANYVEVPIVLDRLRDQIAFFASPLLYLYVLSCIYSDFKLQPKHLLHFIPFAIELFMYFPNFYLASNEQRILFYENYYSYPEVKISLVYGVSVALFYLVLIFIELRKYRKLLLENYSSTKNYNYKWLFQLAVISVVLLLFSAIKSIYKLFDSDDATLDIMRIITTLLLLGFLCWIVLKSMLQPELFRGIDTKHQLVRTMLENEGNEVDEEDEISTQINTLKTYMDKEEPFLDSSLTIHNLANQMNISYRDLSVLINHHLKQHFFDFVNGYRIEKAKEILQNPSNKKRTVLEILYEVGFNSKSSFNTEFKKQTGLTPTQYRRNYW
ncbi:helix-turn-helix domain-containing protein [Tenacibaculum sp. 190130A14a]